MTFDSSKYVSRKELMEATGIGGNSTISNYLREYGCANRPIPRERKDEIVEYIKERYKKGKVASQEALVRGRGVLKEKRQLCDWRVSLQGKSGWIVVRTGTRDEMEPWAALLVKNGIKARASRNNYKGEE